MELNTQTLVQFIFASRPQRDLSAGRGHRRCMVQARADRLPQLLPNAALKENSWSSTCVQMNGHLQTHQPLPACALVVPQQQAKHHLQLGVQKRVLVNPARYEPSSNNSYELNPHVRPNCNQTRTHEDFKTLNFRPNPVLCSSGLSTWLCSHRLFPAP